MWMIGFSFLGRHVRNELVAASFLPNVPPTGTGINPMVQQIRDYLAIPRYACICMSTVPVNTEEMRVCFSASFEMIVSTDVRARAASERASCTFTGFWTKTQHLYYVALDRLLVFVYFYHCRQRRDGEHSFLYQ